MQENEHDNLLLEQFFSQQRQEIADNGFSNRVMHRLPDRRAQISRWWSAAGFTMALVMFVKFDGPRLVLDTLKQTANILIQNSMETELDLKTVAIAGVVLLCLGYKKLASLA